MIRFGKCVASLSLRERGPKHRPVLMSKTHNVLEVTNIRINFIKYEKKIIRFFCWNHSVNVLDSFEHYRLLTQMWTPWQQSYAW